MRNLETIQKDMAKMLVSIDKMRSRLKTRQEMMHEASPSMRFDYVHEIEIAKMAIKRLTASYQKLVGEEREANPNKPSVNEDIIQQLTKILENHPINLKDIAVMAGISRTHLIAIRAGRTIPTITMVERICRVVGFELILRKK